MEQLEKLAEQKEKDRRMRFQVAHEEFTKLEDKLRKALAEVRDMCLKIYYLKFCTL